MNQDSRVIAIALGIVVVVGGGWFWWSHQQTPPPPPPQVFAPPPPAPPAPRPPDVASPPAILHPVASDEPRDKGLPTLAEADGYVRSALEKLLGRKAVLSFLSNVEGVVLSFVTTVDNLGNERAQSQLWPVKTIPGAFGTEPGAAGNVISPQNDARYAPFVHFVESVDTRRAVSLYVRLYPLFQQAYEELGYPGKYFNDRVVEVIDQLVATPSPEGPIKVKRIEVQGATRPLYQFEDPSLEARSAGQKILLRVGRDNATRLKAKLSEIRQRIAKGPGAR